MNSEQERPFVCSAPGCSQRFPTEDHLMIHRHKHEMTLKFPPIKTDNLLSDQTPTPTRFLKNCEEVGLFNELELEPAHTHTHSHSHTHPHTHPHTHTELEPDYCKTQREEEEDSKQNLSLHGQPTPQQHQQQPPPHPRMGSHDNGRMGSHDNSMIQQPLPSPQSSSVITQAPSTNRQIGPVPGSLSSLLHLRNRQRQPLPASMPGTLPDPAMPGSSVLMPMERGMSMMGMQAPPPHSSCSSPLGPNMHSEAKLRLKAALAHHPGGGVANGGMGHMMDMMTSSRGAEPGAMMSSRGAEQHMQHQQQQHMQGPTLSYQTHTHSHTHTHHHPGHTHTHTHPAHMHPHSHSHTHQTSPHHMHAGAASQLDRRAAAFREEFGFRSDSDADDVPPSCWQSQQMAASGAVGVAPPSGGRRRRAVDEDPDERRRKFLERNRAAATRCRQKRKVWVMSLEKKAEELTQTNMQLQNEVTLLKSEVTQLKQLLLTHKDCPITAMQKENQGYLSPESSPAGSPSSQQVIQHSSVSTSSTHTH
ncbi:cyclic AMP-responsive element-binding protein 5 isoform X2 [Engraulis encrasicolus]|uniref:cyclic AMP-responsive element-binding protein 5 isoform X2 n=1 Tax=Engraulis encrasicolus TaxID=184585 RepID=UPI002FD581DF